MYGCRFRARRHSCPGPTSTECRLSWTKPPNSCVSAKSGSVGGQRQQRRHLGLEYTEQPALPLPATAEFWVMKHRSCPESSQPGKKLIHPDDKPMVMKALNEHLQNEKPFRCELRLKTKRGDWLWMLGRGEAVRDKKSGIATRMAGSYTDISEQKATNWRLSRRRTRQVTLQSITDAVVTTDNQAISTTLNPRPSCSLDCPTFPLRAAAARCVQADRCSAESHRGRCHNQSAAAGQDNQIQRPYTVAQCRR